MRWWLFIGIICLSWASWAQSDEDDFDWEYKKQPNQKHESGPIAHKLSVGIGFANYNGDINPSTFSFSPGMAYDLGFRFFMRKRWTFNPHVSIFSLHGEDKKTGDAVRNLSFTTSGIEYGFSIYYDFIDHQPRWDLRKKVVPFVLSSINGLYFNPTTKLAGNTVDLQPLQTEGIAYSRTTLSLGVGAGVHLAITPRSNINLLFRYNYSFSDYLDDVSQQYVDPASLTPLGASLADRTFEGNNTPTESFDGVHWKPGSQRGSNSLNDRYLLFFVQYEVDIFNHRIVYPAF